MENSTELCENVSVTASENTNNSEIESKTIDEDNKMSEEVTANLSEIKEKEVKALNTKKSFKWTNEATKAAACMLKDIIDEYNKANSDLSSSLDENTDPWGFEKLNEQMKVLKQSIELDLYPEEWCRFKLASLIKKYFDEHTNIIENIKYHNFLWCDFKNNNNFIEKDFNNLYIALSQIGKYKIDFHEIARRCIEGYYDTDEEGIFCIFNFWCDNQEPWNYDTSDFITSETISAGALIEDIYYTFLEERKINSENSTESEKIEDCIKINRFISIPSEFQSFYLEDLFKKKIFANLPDYKDIFQNKKSCKDKFVRLMLVLAAYTYKHINFLTLADYILSDEINNLKGLKETYSSMFDE